MVGTRQCLFPLSALLMAFFPSPILAAELSCGDNDVACDEPAIELAPIVVTATRRESPIERVPTAVTALSGDVLKAMGAASFADYARSVPGLSFTDIGLGGKHIVIRGVSTGIYGGSDAATAVYFDETPITDGNSGPQTYSPDPLLVDIARIEVLCGPQGTLFGSGSMGGAIRIITNQPDLDAWEGFAESTLTDTRHGGLGHDLRAMLNVPLANGHAAVRAVAFHRNTGGWSIGY
jgi:outer membrane receptor protein involved in Fe transport